MFLSWFPSVFVLQCITGVNPDKTPKFGACTETATHKKSVPFSPDLSAGLSETDKVFDRTKWKSGGMGFYCPEDVRDPDLMVWMRTSALPKFKKLHRIIPENQLKPGKYNLEVLSR